MQTEQLYQKLRTAILGGSPGIYLHSGEEARVDQLLMRLQAECGLQRVHEWNLGHGWVRFTNKQPLQDMAQDTALEHCLRTLPVDELENSLILIKGARLALENNPLAVARLKQLLNRIERHHSGECSVVLVAEAVHIPPHIEAQISLLHLPLPDRSEIAALLQAAEAESALPMAAEQRAQIIAGLSGLTSAEIRQVLRRITLPGQLQDGNLLSVILDEKQQIIAKSGVLEMVRSDVGPQDIGGLENLKQWLTQRAQIVRELERASALGVKTPKGVLIAGMPGCGKSLTAKVAAQLFQLPLLRLDIGSLLGKYVGESEHNMRRALSMAETISPCVLWIDELEKAFVGLGSGNASEVTARLLGYFLTWMQEKTGAVFVIATANNISALPPELLRKGRFDEVFYVGFPNAAERRSILEIQLRRAEPGQGIQLDELVGLCRDYSGADIENAVNEARTNAFLASQPLGQSHLREAIRATIPLRETLREQIGQYEELFEKLKLRPASTQQGLNIAQMRKLAGDPNPLRRKEVAEHPDCPPDLLEKLAGDTEKSVQLAVLHNPQCPERVLSARINIQSNEEGYNEQFLIAACQHINTPADLVISKVTQSTPATALASALWGGATNNKAQAWSSTILHKIIEGCTSAALQRALLANRSNIKLLPDTTIINLLACNQNLTKDVKHGEELRAHRAEVRQFHGHEIRYSELVDHLRQISSHNESLLYEYDLSAHLKVFEHDARRFWPYPRQNAASSRLATQKNERKLSLEHLHHIDIYDGDTSYGDYKEEFNRFIASEEAIEFQETFKLCLLNAVMIEMDWTDWTPSQREIFENWYDTCEVEPGKTILDLVESSLPHALKLFESEA